MDSLQQFSRHVPQLLRHQILLDLVKEYLRSDISLISPSLSRGPSMQRFQGALLFIDISGFTVLSQKLDIESLKNNINDYFTKMLTIIQKWGGDVIKFAGDALYIVWQVRDVGQGDESQPGLLKKEESKTLDTTSETNFPRIMSSREAVDRATSCAAEICSTCSNYEVKIQNLDRRGSTNAFQYKSASTTDGNIDDVTYLDVHAGLSFGTMAGINIGKETRWEYFLAGSPLADVAAAEEKAKKGDVVICKDAHELWHGLDDKVIDEDGMLLCGCRLVEDRFYFVSKTSQIMPQTTAPPRTLRRKSSRLSRKEGMKDILTHGTRMHEDFTTEIELIYEKIRPMLELLFIKIVLGEAPVTDDESVDALRQDFDCFYENDCRRKFSTWMVKAMTDELAKHVHDVERKNHAFHEPYLKERYYDNVHQWVQFDRQHRHDNINVPGVLETQASINSADLTTRELGVDLQSVLTETRLQKSQYHNVFGGSSALAAEIFLHSSEKRSLVTVMFVKIETITIEINMYEGRRDHHNDQHLEKLLGFIPRTVQEYEEDSRALERLQRCFSVICEAIYSTEGQLRQFIIDDKGTVCIATFGLMGSVSVDNAASAIACAEKIILGLEGIDLNARIGVTTGEAYCGVVGSSIRHEYAVMGPSTNLSARLMCRADIRSIICDETTFGQDRANKFILLDELKDVKGYSHPVKIFQPRSSVDLLNSNLIHDVTGKSEKTVRSAIITSKFVKGVYNVMKKVKKNVLFNAKIAKSRAKIREIYQSEFVFLCEDRMKELSKDNRNSKRQVSEKKVEVYRKLYGRQQTIQKVFEAIIPSFGTIQNVIFEIDSMCRMVVVGSSVGGGKSAIISAISLKLQTASENDPQLNFFIVSDNTFSKLRLKATVPLSYWGFILFDLLKIVATNFQMTMDPTLSPQEQSRLRYLHTFDSLMQQFPEHIRDPKNLHLLLRLMKLDNSLGKSTVDDNKAAAATNDNNNANISSNHHFVRNELEILMEMIVYFVDLIPKIMNRAMILVLDDAHFLDSWSLKALHEVWQNVRGVCMILSFNPTQYHAANMTADHLNHQESFYSISSNSMLNTKASMRLINKPSTLQDDIFSDYAGSERFEYIELPALKFEDTKLIAQDLLGASVELNEAEFRQLFDISNGNPLYTVELIYAILAHGGRTENASAAFAKNKSMSSLSFDARGNVISTPTSRNRDLRLFFNKSKRLEEVIYYRLDQLHSRAQVLLKAASVAVSNGRSFSLELIYFMLDQNDLLPGPKVTAPARKRGSMSTANITSLSDTLDDRDNENHANNNNTNEYDSFDSQDMHLAEQIIPFLIEHKIFIRISQPKSIASMSVDQTMSSSEPGSSGSDKTTGALPPPRASQLMKEQEKLNRQLKIQQLHQARSELLLNDNNTTAGVRQPSQFDFDSIAMSHLPVDEYDEDDGDDDDYIPENFRSNKKNRSKQDMFTADANKPITYYEFIAPIEQSTIYGLITDDQRKYFHERVASFYRESMLEMDEEEHEPEVVLVDIPGAKQARGSTPVPPVPPTDAAATSSSHSSSSSSLPVPAGELMASPSVTFNAAVQLAPSPSIASVPSDDRWSGSDVMKGGLRLKVNKDETPENLYEEAFHWEKANYWSTALRTYMRSAELEKERGNENRWVLCLQHALRVYKTIEHEFYQSELPLMPNQKLPYPELIIKILLGKHSKENDVVLYLKSVEKDMNHVWDIFEHDEELIPMVCSLHLALADAYLLSWATLGEIATMAGVALKLMLFLRYQEIFQKSHLHHHPHHPHHHALHRRRPSHSGMSGYDLHNTSNRNMMHTTSLHALPHVMSGFLANHSNVTTPHTGSSAWNLANASFNYKDLFKTKTFQADPHHLISTLHIIHNTVMRYERPDDRDGTYYYYIAFKMGELIVDVDDETQNICLKAMKGLRQKDYVKVADTIAPLLTVSSAEFFAKSAQRVKRFGVDLLPSIVSELAQSFFLTQEKHRFHELLETPLYESLLRIPHLPSVENALLPLMVLLTYSEDFRLYRKLRSACKTLLVDRKNDLVLIQGMFQDIVQCWGRSFLALYCPDDVPVPQRDHLSLSSMMMGMDMAEKLFESVQPDADPEEREMSNVEVKSLLRYGAAMESLALQMVCGLMLFVPTDGLDDGNSFTSFEGVEHADADAAASAAAAGTSLPSPSFSSSGASPTRKALAKTSSLHAIVEQDEHEDSPRDALLEKDVSITLDDRPGLLSKEGSLQQLRLDVVSQDTGVEPPTAAYVDDLFSRWWDRMFTDLYTLRYLHLLNILNPLLLLCRVLTKHQVNLTLPYTEARILLFFARFKTEIVHVCKKHKYLVTMEKFLAVENLFVERRKERGGRVRTASSSGYSGVPPHPSTHPNHSGEHLYASSVTSGDADEDYTTLSSASSTPTTSHRKHSSSNVTINNNNNYIHTTNTANSTNVNNANNHNNNNNPATSNNTQPTGSSSPPVPLSKLTRPSLSRRTFTPQSLQEIIRTVERKTPSVASNTASPRHVRGGVSGSGTPVSPNTAAETKDVSGPRGLLKRSLDSKTWNKNLEKSLSQDADDEGQATIDKK